MPIPDNETHITLSMPMEILESVDRIAAALGRDRDDVLRSAVVGYLEGQGAEILEDAEGLDDLDSGRFMEADLVLRDARAIVASARKQRAAKAG